MPDLQVSRTALGTAFLRAVHQVYDAKPLILEDPIAALLIGEEGRRKLASPAFKERAANSARLRSRIVLRSRFAEDCLAEAVSRGVRQYVILGAGLDSFAWRQPEWAKAIRIIEVDQLATQAVKRSLLSKAGLAIPENTRLLAVDFERETLESALERSGLSIDQPAFFSWLGVTMYLQRPAVEAVLTTTGAYPSGSGIVLTFAPPRAAGNDPIPTQLQARVTDLGEPFVSFFSRKEMEALLSSCGFTRVDFLSSEQVRSRYYNHRPADLPVPERTGLVEAGK